LRSGHGVQFAIAGHVFTIEIHWRSYQ
jgi:hypothetical protein